jgi:hypothetical protein
MMFRGVIIAAIAIVSPLQSSAAEKTAKSSSGIILPQTIEGLNPVTDDRPPLPFDAHKSFSAPGETVTIYVFRATYPNAALWFERADAILKRIWTPKGLGEGGKTTTFAAAGSLTSNGMRRTYSVKGPTKSTAVAVVQVGQWLIKIRSTSASLDATAQSARMDRIIASLQTREPLKSANPLTLPSDCPIGSHSVFDSLGSEVIAKPKSEMILIAGIVALKVAADATEAPDSLASAPEKFCRGTLTDGDLAAVYWPKDDKTKGWTMLLADSGRSVSGVPMPILDGKSESSGGMLTVNGLERVEVIMLTKGGLPMADASVGVGFNQLTKGGPAMTSVDYGTNTVNVAFPK